MLESTPKIVQEPTARNSKSPKAYHIQNNSKMKKYIYQININHKSRGETMVRGVYSVSENSFLRLFELIFSIEMFA